MKRLWTLIAISTLVTAACTATDAQQDTGAASKPAIIEGNIATITATVEAIDLPNRMVTVVGPGGNRVTITAGEGVRNLAQIQIGDQVSVQYYESVAVQVFSPDTVEGGVQAAEVLARAEPGAKPAGAVIDQVTVTTTLEAIDRERETVTLKGPLGNSRTIKVRDPSNLDKVAVGDQVVITYTEALAIAVDKLQ